MALQNPGLSSTEETIEPDSERQLTDPCSLEAELPAAEPTGKIPGQSYKEEITSDGMFSRDAVEPETRVVGKVMDGSTGVSSDSFRF